VQYRRIITLLTEIIRDIKAWWTWLVDASKIFLAFGEFPGIHQFSLSEKDKMIK